MKKIFILLFVIFSLLFTGCSGKANVSKSSSNNSTVNNSSKTESTKLKAVTPNTVKPLTAENKAKVKNNISSAVKDIDDSLNSLDDINDLDLSSIN